MQGSTRGEDRVSVRLVVLRTFDCTLHTADGCSETLWGENSGHQLAETAKLSQGSVESLDFPILARGSQGFGDGSIE